MKVFLKAFPALIFWGVFIWVIFFVNYPTSLTQANAKQLLLFFLPLYFAISFSLSLIIKNLMLCFILSLALILLLVLKALNSLNFVSGGLAVLAVILLVSNFKRSHRGLTKEERIPKLGSLQRKK